MNPEIIKCTSKLDTLARQRASLCKEIDGLPDESLKSSKLDSLYKIEENMIGTIDMLKEVFSKTLVHEKYSALGNGSYTQSPLQNMLGVN